MWELSEIHSLQTIAPGLEAGLQLIFATITKM